MAERQYICDSLPLPHPLLLEQPPSRPVRSARCVMRFGGIIPAAASAFILHPAFSI